jgi:uncharacterized protein
MTHPAPEGTEATPRRIIIAGATGFLGSALVRELAGEGITVHRLSRHTATAPGDIIWHPERGELDPGALEGAEAIVNLAGEPIAQRWTPEKKAAIRDSRILATTLLSKTIARLQRPPRLFLSGSAIGIYGDRGDEELDEDSSPGKGFLAETAVAWERAAEAASSASTRVLLLRTGVVLNPEGGALAKMLLPYKLGLGGRVGSGKQWMSWIGREDWVRAVLFLLRSTTIRGPVNLVAPIPVPNAEFTRTLARVVGRPTLGLVPAVLVDLVFGEMGRETLLGSQRLHPRRLTNAGFQFAHSTLEPALRAELS